MSASANRPARPEDIDEICGSLPETGEMYDDLVQQSRLGEISRQELVEVITEAWAAKAPKKLVREHFGE